WACRRRSARSAPWPPWRRGTRTSCAASRS
ncbi:MAG: hypothetical protein AVDCRST_MAG08-3857, partial [uncultured Acetobacteraceae bacterium]